MKKIRLLALLILGMFMGTSAYAQAIQVSGVVTSQEDGQPLPGVTVFVKGTTQGMATGADGRYSINNVPSNGTLEFRYVGMRTQEVAVAGKSAIHTVMVPDAIEADAIVVTALGGRKQDRKVGYATTTVAGDELARTTALNPMAALQGKVAGVRVMGSTSSGVTSDPAIVIRGAKSLTKSNAPIFVIDGIVIEHFENNGGGVSGENNGYGSQLKNFNMGEFESVTVLKGAAATSLYGSRGANGAIVVTSKSGRARKGVGVEVNYSHTFGQVYKSPFDLQNSWGGGNGNNGYEGDVIPGSNSSSTDYIRVNWGPSFESIRNNPTYDGKLTAWYKTDPFNTPVEEYRAYEDNWRELFQNSSQDRVSVALTGGSERATYRLSYSYTSDKGNAINNKFKAHEIRFVTNGDINDYIRTNFSLQYTNSNAYNRNNQGVWAHGDNYDMLTGYYLNRNVDLKWYRENYILEDWSRIPDANGSNGSGRFREYFNKDADNRNVQQEQSIIANLGITAQLTDWLDLGSSISYNNWNVQNVTTNYGNDKYRLGGNGRYEVKTSNRGSFDAMVNLHSNNKFVDDNLELDVRVLAQAYGPTYSQSASKSTRDGLQVPGVWSFNNTKEPITQDQMGMASAKDLRRNSLTLGIGAIATLTWKNQITLEVVGRNDWLSSLTYPNYIAGANNYSVFYPNVNSAWVFSDTFEIDPEKLSYGKVRASWAQVGMGTGAYATSDGVGGYNVNSDLRNPLGENIFQANRNIDVLPNFDLKPEIQQSIEFGTDLRFLNDRIGLDITYYKSNTKNQIMRVGQVTESGVNDRLINAGNIQNQGWELSAVFTPIRTREVEWKIGGNWTRDRGLIKELSEGINEVFLLGNYENTGNTLAAVNGPYGVLTVGGRMKEDARAKNEKGQYLIKYAGLSSVAHPGGTKYTNQIFTYIPTNDIDKYYGVDEHGNPNSTDNYTILGKTEPDFYYGFYTTVDYKGFDLGIYFDGRQGGVMPSPGWTYVANGGATNHTNFGRDQANGGLKRLNYDGQEVYNGYIIDGVFGPNPANENKVVSLLDGSTVSLTGMTMVEAIAAGHIQPMLTSTYYQNNMSSRFSDLLTPEMTFLRLREVTLGYNFPQKWMSKVGVQSLRLQFSAQNVCFLVNKMLGKSNPEGSANNSVTSPALQGGAAFNRTYSLSLNVRF